MRITPSPYGPYKLGYTHATLIISKSCTIIKFKVNLKILLCSDCRLQLVYIKLESLVIVDQHAMVNKYLDFAHTARHMLGVNLV